MSAASSQERRAVGVCTVPPVENRRCIRVGLSAQRAEHQQRRTARQPETALQLFYPTAFTPLRSLEDTALPALFRFNIDPAGR
jgi:hypothetical protein